MIRTVYVNPDFIPHLIDHIEDGPLQLLTAILLYAGAASDLFCDLNHLSILTGKCEFSLGSDFEELLKQEILIEVLHPDTSPQLIQSRLNQLSFILSHMKEPKNFNAELSEQEDKNQCLHGQKSV